MCIFKNKGVKGKIDLYLEGSDQHRGWFHIFVGIMRGLWRKSNKSVLTHSFVIDKKAKRCRSL